MKLVEIIVNMKFEWYLNHLVIQLLWILWDKTEIDEHSSEPNTWHVAQDTLGKIPW